MAAPPGLLEVGRAGRTHGVRGDIYVDLYDDSDARVSPGARLWAAERWHTVDAAKRSSKRWIVRFSGMENREDAARLTNATLHGEPIDDPDALWVHNLVGCQVVEVDRTMRGRCVAVVANPAHDILELDTGSLVPVVFVVSCEDGVITIDPPAGLFETDG